MHTHLRCIFHKLGANDQPALVRVLTCAVAVLPADGRKAGQAAGTDTSAKHSDES